MTLADGSFTHAVTDGPLVVAAGVAALVGLIGFLSPCVLPLVPGYLSYVAGLSGTDEKPSQLRMVLGAVMFVLGFTAIFVVQGIAFGALGSSIRDNSLVIERVLGGVTILMGIVFLGGVSFLQREFRMHRLPRAGLVGAPLLGAAFGLAWAPCLTRSSPSATAWVSVCRSCWSRSGSAGSPARSRSCGATSGSSRWSAAGC
jgi:cytochrome c-type biogenesis protein